MPSVRCGDIDLSYTDHGTGPAIVWIPGTGLQGTTWELQLARFRDRFRCLTVDLRGSGQTRSRQTSDTNAGPGPHQIGVYSAHSPNALVVGLLRRGWPGTPGTRVTPPKPPGRPSGSPSTAPACPGCGP
jgi:pimeloyl-ACP methyl ester carboxylesterase